MEKELSFSDHAIATDMLFEAKASIKDIATAITETTSSDIRSLLKQELKIAMKQHEQLYGFLQDRGIYDAYDVPGQLQNDLNYVDQALNQ